MPKTYTFQEFQKDYPDDPACLEKIMQMRYGDKPYCHGCKEHTTHHRISKRRAYACQNCGTHVYPCVGTPFEKSTTGLHKWFYAIYLFTTTRHGVPAKELERQLGVTYKCAWRMAHEIRKLMAGMDVGGLFGEVEADETYVGGRRKGPHGRGVPHKTVVLGMKERSGPVKTRIVPDAKRASIEPILRENIREGSKVHTDEWWAYRKLGQRGYKHESVHHGSGQWVSGGSHTNSIEGYWSLLKRSIRGTHVHVSKQHMSKYLGEFDFRHNMRSMPDQMFHLLIQMIGNRKPA